MNIISYIHIYTYIHIHIMNIYRNDKALSAYFLRSKDTQNRRFNSGDRKDWQILHLKR